MKHHISKDGIARRCTAASIETCRAEKAEGFDQHFDSMEEATKAYEQSRHAETFTKLRKPLNLPKIFNMEEEVFDEEEYVAANDKFRDKLTEEEVLALEGYVIEHYQEINEALYGKREMTKDVEKQVEVVDSALSKSEAKAPKAVWRSFGGLELNKEFQSKGYKVGDTVEFDGYTSTSETLSAIIGLKSATSWYMQETDPDEWETEPGNKYAVKVPDYYKKNGMRNVLLHIRPKHAAPVSMFRGRATEQEWLIPRGAKFKVSEIYEDRELIGSRLMDETYADVYVLDEI